MSFIAGTMEGMGIGAAAVEAAWKAPLAILVGTYALKEQHNTLNKQVALGARAVAVGEQFLSITNDNYNSVTQVAFNELQAYFVRYKDTFQPYETKFVDQAFNPTDYVLDYASQHLRVASINDTQFANAAYALKRFAGTYREPTDRKLRPLNTYFNNAYQASKVEAVSDSYRYEEDRQRWWLQFYWKKLTAGISFVEGMAKNVVGAVNSGVQVSSAGISALGGAYGQLQREMAQKEGALANMANMWGGMANGAMGLAGHSAGIGSGHGFAGAAAEANTPSISFPGKPDTWAW